MNKKVWLFHLLNDFSGSPLVLKNTVLALQDKADITICTSSSEGFLSNLLFVNYHHINYQWYPNKLLTLLRFFVVQLSLVRIVIANRKKIDIVYVNTLLPFGAALGAWLCSKKVIYHMHEPQINPRSLFLFLSFVAVLTADKVLFVSAYLKSCFPKLESRGILLPNVLNEEFKNAIEPFEKTHKTTVLMLCSYKEYKGVNDFIELARINTGIDFELILNTQKSFINDFIEEHRVIKNLKIYPCQKDVHPFYEKAKIVLNLSHPDQWIESFGMTALEAMAYGIPCIVPEEGGIAELITTSSGFRIIYKDYQQISDTINLLFKDQETYDSYSTVAKERSQEYSFINYKSKILEML